MMKREKRERVMKRVEAKRAAKSLKETSVVARPSKGNVF